MASRWRQRTRWSYGGITVVVRAARPSAVLQDILGHVVFLSTLLMVAVLFFSSGSGFVPPGIARAIIVLSFAQLIVWYGFQLWLMRLYAEKDRWDWLLRATLLPEFAYSYIMTFALLGSYVFHMFATLTRTTRQEGKRAQIVEALTRFFKACGYSERSWGSRKRLV